MKISVLGLEDFPIGKKNLIDERLKILEGLIKPSKTTYITLEFLDKTNLKDADAVICEIECKLDLVINDLEIIENRIERTKDDNEMALFGRAKEILEKNKCLSEEDFNVEEKKILVNSNLMSIKPIFFVDKKLNKSAQEIMFDGFYWFGMICFITGAKDKELRAWLIKKGTNACEAAGAIHSDIQRGFIKAEVIGYEDLVKAGGINSAKQYIHLEGKDYIVCDADFMNFRFNV